MVRAPDRETFLRWMFLGLGWFLFAGHNFVLSTLLQMNRRAADFYPDSASGRLAFRNAVVLLLVASFILSFITSWGLKRRRIWSRWTGVIAAAGLLPGLPWLTPVGAVCLFLLLYKPMALESARGQDYWDPNRQSLLVVIASVAGFLLAMQSLQWFEKFALQMGLPDQQISGDQMGLTLAVLLVFLLVVMWLHVILHELGHALAAVLVGFRLQAVSAGPLMMRKQGGRYRLRFDWKRMISGGGYMGATPVSQQDIRWKEILVVAAGPLASFGAALALSVAFFHLAGTPLAPYWHVFAISSALGFYAGLTNLIPSGYTDGNMLLHLVFHTRRGDDLIACLLAGKFLQDAHERHEAGDHESTVELRREALERLEARGERNLVQLASSYSELGLAELAAGSDRQAEATLRKALEILNRSPGHPGVEANCWIGLNRVYRLRQQPAEVAETYAAARKALERMDADPPAGIDRCLVLGGLAELHVNADAFAEALEPIAATLALVGKSRRHRGLRGMMLRLRAECELQLGRTAEGLATADEAMEVLLAGDECEGGMSTSMQELGFLGLALWSGGETDRAVATLWECVRGFEARGEPNPAARFRLALSNVLLAEGRLSEAESALPGFDRICSSHRLKYLDLHAAICRRTGRAEQAVADCQELLRLTEEDGLAGYMDVTDARSSLAEAYVDAGNLEQAELLARQAYDEFHAVNHPDLAGVCVTLALVAWHREGSTGAWLEQGLRTFAEAPLIRTSTQARFLESTAHRLERAGLLNDAGECRHRAAALRGKLAAASA